MLQTLTGNHTLQSILYFLLVNREAYPSQVKRQLDLSLTPIQRAFDKLEKGGFVQGAYRGKTRLFSFNSAHPLFGEIEQLLRKGFSLLPHEEQKRYYNFSESKPNQSALSAREKRQIVTTLWKQLCAVKEVTYRAKDPLSPHARLGKGAVAIERPSERECIFRKQGTWKVDGGYEMGFSNAFRWTLSEKKDQLSLEHLRFGDSHPVFLFFLNPTSEKSFLSDNQSMGEGCAGKMRFEEHYIQLTLREISPQKNEEIDYMYL